MNRRSAALAAALLLVLAGIVFIFGRERNDAPALDDFGPAPAFLLLDHDGNPFTSGDLAGRVWIANFVYTHCTDTCPGLTAKMQRIQRFLATDPQAAKGIALLSFTTDPARDTPAVLREYGRLFGADFSGWTFLTSGADDVLKVIVDGFRLGVSVGGSPAGAALADADGYEVFHSNRFVVVDREGKVRALPDGLEVEAEEILAIARSLI